MLKPGIYEQVLNKLISNDIDSSEYIVEKGPIDSEEAAKVLASYLAGVILQGLTNIKDKGGQIGDQIAICNDLINTMVANSEDAALAGMTVDRRAQMLLAFLERQNSAYAVNEKADIVRPATSIASSSLFTGSAYEPSMLSELKKEIISSDRIDMLVSFIKWSGLRIIIDELKEFTKRGKLRIITTSYMGATDVKAVEALGELPNTEIKISYETRNTRLHAKSYVFHRQNGFSTAYVGSSNLSGAAISAGLEWNVKLTQKDQADIIKKIEATFETYWNDREFVSYHEGDRQALHRAIVAERHTGGENISFNFDITPYPYQSETLDQLEAERKVRGHWRNLVVAATGTGKTVISAFDYKRFCSEKRDRPARLLFVAHREEILKQSLACFRTVLKDPNFGELFVGGYSPGSIDHLFISIQTFNSRELDSHTSPDYYDYIIVDEFHHAAASSYQKLLTHYNPKILLGLTATPERMDGKSVLEFGNRIAAEIRLPEAIDRKLLSPFQYFGVTDTVDLDTLRWSRGGYDRGDLSKVYTGNDARAKHVITSVNRYVTDINEVKGLGFCVSIEHAGYMASFFNHFGIPAMALSNLSGGEERNNAKMLLTRGEIKFIFVVDLYNEGVDIPEVNTILFLRPTESLTVFLQQLGRGLRLHEDKECLTVLDFIGQANRKYNFEDKFKALLINTTRNIQRNLTEGFAGLPKGCFIQLEKKAQEYILNNIRSSLGRLSGFIARLASFEEDTGETPTLAKFLEYYHLEAREFYGKKTSFSRLSVRAGIREDFKEPDETVLQKTLARLCAIDSRRWIEFLLKVLQSEESLDENTLTETERKMLLMAHYTVWQKNLADSGFNTLAESIKRIRQNAVMFEELVELLRYCYDKIDFVDQPVELGFNSPLDLHCTYTRDQVLAAVDYYTTDRMPAMREGVKHLQNKMIDIFFITLNKANKQYSPSTMYDDYSINEWLFHWQSQSTTAEHSPTGQRYINHRKNGSRVALFVREFKNDAAGAAPYTFLGLAHYVQHQGSKPMSIVWRLERPIPAKFLKKTNKMIVG